MYIKKHLSFSLKEKRIIFLYKQINQRPIVKKIWKIFVQSSSCVN